jgi:hypothetical protein
MLQENVEVVKGLIPPNREIDSQMTAERRAVMRAVFEPLIAPGFSVKFVAAGFTAAYPGADGMADGVVDYTSGFLDFRMVMERIIDGGEVIVGLGRQRGRTKTHGLEFDEEMGMVFFFDPQQRLTRIECHQRWNEALEAAGLSE